MAARILGFSLIFTLASAVSSVAQAEFVPVAGFDQQLFPSYLIATASLRTEKSTANAHRLGDPSGILGVEVVAPADDVAIKVTIECDDYFSAERLCGNARGIRSQISDHAKNQISL